MNFWKNISARRRKIILWILGLLLFYTVTGFFILPPIVRAVAVKKISQQLDRDVSIQKVKINPFVLSTTIRGLLIKDKDGQPFVSWDRVYVNFQLSSLFSPAWTFKEISVTNPYVRVQINPDRTFNFSDILARLSTNAAPARSPSKPLLLHVEQLRIAGAAASFTDLTTRHPFKRIIGPLDVTLENFQTSPDNKNPYAFSGTTDAGEKFAWRGFFYLDPLRSRGELTLDDITLNKYAPLYQDFVRFEIRDGNIGVHASYRMEMGKTNLELSVTNTAFALRQFKLGVPGKSNNAVELDHFAVTGASVDLQTRQAEVGSILASGGRLDVRRNRDASVNVLELAKPAVTDEQPSGGIEFLLRSVTNAVAMLMNSTNQWSGTIHNINVTNCALHLEDLVNVRPARLDLNDIALDASNISNLSGTNLTAALSLRWNTNGAIHADVAASFAPTTADVDLSLSNLNLDTLEPYLESKVNVLVLNSRLGLDGHIHLRTPENQLPQVTFQGDARLDDLHTVDGIMGADLLKWGSVRLSGIDANLNPETVSVHEIAVDDAYARVVIETNHTINLLVALQPADTNALAGTNATVAAVSSGTNSAFALPKISVGSIVVSNATIAFTDRSLEPNVNLNIEQAGGAISGISSEEWQRADVNLHALVDNVGPADITGHINPFSGTQTNDIKILVKNVDLTPASPYSGKFAGYRIAEGKLNLDLEYNLVGRKLESKNLITLDRFTFGEKVNSPDATKLPVRLAVAILKDRNGQIVLDVPIEGSLDDPKFRIGKVVTRAVLNILTKVATSPFSLLGAAFGGSSGDELSYQDFAPGSAELTPADKQKLDTLVKALYDRPGLSLEIAGSVEPASDRDGIQRVALDKQLRLQKWQSLRKADRATMTPDEITLTPPERARFIKKLFGEAQAAGKITPELIAANTNLAVAAAQISRSQKVQIEKGATILMKGSTAPASAGFTNAPPAASVLPPVTDPEEALLLATFPAGENELETLAADRAKAVRDYLLQSGKVEAARLFLTESQTGGVRSDGSRAYLQLR